MTFTGTLYPFQEEAYESMCDRGQMMLCMVMGSGKTPTTIATLETLFERDDISRALIVVPSSLWRCYRGTSPTLIVFVLTL